MNKKEEQQRKDLLDPATSAVIGAGLWFTIKAAAQGIVGFLALEWFKRARNWWKGANVEADDQRISKEEPSES